MAVVDTDSEQAAAARWPDALLDHLRGVGDPLADAALDELTQNSAAHGRAPDLFAAVSERAQKHAGPCRDLDAQVRTVPPWVSFPRMHAGYRVGRSYPVAGGLALLCGSLAESYSSGLAAKVLIRTGNLSRSTRRRIYETAEFLNVLALSGGPRPGTTAHRVLCNLRLLHARIRAAMQRRSDWEPQWGVPVNQEDNGSTLLMFSLVFARSLRRLGVLLSEEELDSIHHSWRYGGYVLGIDERLVTASLAEEQALYAVIARRQHRPDQDSLALVGALFQAMAWQPPFFVPAPALHAISRRLLGEPLADALQVPRSALWQAAPAAMRALGRTQHALCGAVPGAPWLAQYLGTSLIELTLKYGLGRGEAVERVGRTAS